MKIENSKLKIFFASDHTGFEMKNELFKAAQEMDAEVYDLGPAEFNEDDDYPEFIKKAAQKVAKDPENSRAIVIGKSGQGEAMVANRFKNVRAVVYYGSTPGIEGQNAWFSGSLNKYLKTNSQKIIKLSREHNDANVLSLGAGFLSVAEAKEVAELWLNTAFSGEERHKRRIEQIDK